MSYNSGNDPSWGRMDGQSGGAGGGDGSAQSGGAAGGQQQYSQQQHMMGGYGGWGPMSGMVPPQQAQGAPPQQHNPSYNMMGAQGYGTSPGMVGSMAMQQQLSGGGGTDDQSSAAETLAAMQSEQYQQQQQMQQQQQLAMLQMLQMGGYQGGNSSMGPSAAQAGYSSMGGMYHPFYASQYQMPGDGGMQSSSAPFAYPSASAPSPVSAIANRPKGKAAKNKLKPKRPLSAYNLFFKDERARLLAEIPDKKGDSKEEDSEEAKDSNKADSDRASKKQKTESDAGADEGGDDDSKKGKTEADEDEKKTSASKDADGEGDEKKTGASSTNTDDLEDKNKTADSKLKRKPHGKISFESMAKTIGARWKKIDPDLRAEYEALAAKDMKRYKAEKETFERKQRQGMEGSRNDQYQQEQLPAEEANSGAAPSAGTKEDRPQGEV